jgi:biofilm PGA synthesis N-glycosyltransferase PgaC
MIKSEKYAIISPVRNEEKYLPQTIKCVLDQTVQPFEYIIVDDGSSDRTPAIIKKASQEYPWIKYIGRPNRGKRKVGPGVIEAFYDGYKALENSDYDFLCKMDGDLTVGPTYFEHLFDKFNRDPYLGSSSGKLYLDLGNGKVVEERISDESVLGGMLAIRRKCFEDIGGFVKQVMWDGIAFHRARMEGWRTRSFRDQELIIYDHRLMGSSYKNIYHGRLRWGWGQYFMGTHPLYILAVGTYRLFEKPLVLGGILIVLGYLKGWVTGAKQYQFPGFKKSLNAWQLERLKLGKRLEAISKS